MDRTVPARTPLLGGFFVMVVVQAGVSSRESQSGCSGGKREAAGSHLEVEAKQTALARAGLAWTGSAVCEG